MSSQRSITQLIDIDRVRAPGVREELFARAYEELRAVARRHLSRESPGHSLTPTALVHESFLRLRNETWKNRAHFFFAASRAMRQILVEAARRRRSPRSGGDRKRVPLEDELKAVSPPDLDLLALDEALHRLHVEFPRKARVVDLHFFGGMTILETAQILRCAPRTADTDWRDAKEWLKGELTRTAVVTRCGTSVDRNK